MILDKFGLTGRSGIVTGAGSGIGRAIARGLSEAGADVQPENAPTQAVGWCR